MSCIVFGRKCQEKNAQNRKNVLQKKIEQSIFLLR